MRWVYNYFKGYLETNQSINWLRLDKGNNIYRVYPHKLFCDDVVKQRCITHDDNNIFYSSANLLSIKGAELVNNLVIKELQNIQK